LSGCDKVSLEPKSLSNLSTLTELDLSVTSRVRTLRNTATAPKHDLASISHLTSLRKLDLSLADVRNIDRIKSLANLQELNMAGCVRALSLDFLAGLVNLQVFDLSGCTKIPVSELQYTSSLINLRKFSIGGVRALADGLQFVPPDNLQELTMSGSLQHIDRFTQLRKLSVDMPTEVKNMGQLTNLEELTLGADGLEDAELSVLTHMSSLRKLSLNDPSHPYRAFPYLTTQLSKLESVSIRSPVLSRDLLVHIRDLVLFPLLKEFVVFYRCSALTAQERGTFEESTEATVLWRNNWD